MINNSHAPRKQVHLEIFNNILGNHAHIEYKSYKYSCQTVAKALLPTVKLILQTTGQQQCSEHRTKRQSLVR